MQRLEDYSPDAHHITSHPNPDPDPKPNPKSYPNPSTSIITKHTMVCFVNMPPGVWGWDIGGVLLLQNVFWNFWS